MTQNQQTWSAAETALEMARQDVRSFDTSTLKTHTNAVLETAGKYREFLESVSVEPAPEPEGVGPESICYDTKNINLGVLAIMNGAPRVALFCDREACAIYGEWYKVVLPSLATPADIHKLWMAHQNSPSHQGVSGV